jgi:hypothetical protein
MHPFCHLVYSTIDYDPATLDEETSREMRLALQEVQEQHRRGAALVDRIIPHGWQVQLYIHELAPQEPSEWKVIDKDRPLARELSVRSGQFLLDLDALLTAHHAWGGCVVLYELRFWHPDVRTTAEGERMLAEVGVKPDEYTECALTGD